MKIQFALDIAKGMAYVHGLNRMHRDLKSGNCLVSSALRIKVADFGTCTFTDITSRQKGDVLLREDVLRTPQPSSMSPGKSGDLESRFHTNGVGTMLWMAPEVIQGELYGREADVYSYGIVLWEIAAQCLPWEELPVDMFYGKILLAFILEGRRPLQDASWPETYVRLMQSCWATKSSERPMFSAICNTALFCDVPTAAMSPPATDGPRANLASITAGKEFELTHISSLGDSRV